MKLSVTLVIFCLFIMVVIAYYYLVPYQEMTKVQTNVVPVEDKLFDLDENDEINWIQIQRISESQSITLDKRDGRWTLRFPLVAPADNLLMDGLTGALKFSRKARRLDREGDWEEYGLKRPEIKVGVETERGLKRKYLLLGDKAPIGSNIFARWEDEDGYFLLDENIKKAFNKSVYTLRLKQIFSKSLQDVNKLRFRSPRAEYEIARHEDDWFWMEPIPLLGELITKAQMDELFTKIQKLYIKDFLDTEVTNSQELGFGVLASYVKVWEVDKDVPESLLIGSDVQGRDAMYGHLEGDSEDYFMMARSNIYDLFRVLDNLEQKFSQQEIPSENVLS